LDDELDNVNDGSSERDDLEPIPEGQPMEYSDHAQQTGSREQQRLQLRIYDEQAQQTSPREQNQPQRPPYSDNAQQISPREQNQPQRPPYSNNARQTSPREQYQPRSRGGISTRGTSPQLQHQPLGLSAITTQDTRPQAHARPLRPINTNTQGIGTQTQGLTPIRREIMAPVTMPGRIINRLGNSIEDGLMTLIDPPIQLLPDRARLTRMSQITRMPQTTWDRWVMWLVILAFLFLSYVAHQAREAWTDANDDSPAMYRMVSGENVFETIALVPGSLMRDGQRMASGF
jgi:hypothetical protein